MVSVGQKYRAAGEGIGNGGLRIGSGDRPEFGVAAGGRGRRGFRRVGDDVLKDAAQVARGVAVQRHYGAELGLAGVQQRHAVADGRLAGEFVGKDGAGVIVIHQHRGKKPQVFIPPAGEVVGVAHQVKAGAVVLAENAGGEPLPQQAGGLPVARFGGFRVGLLAAFQMHGVVGAALL